MTLYGPNETSLGSLTVAGWVDGVTISAQGNLGKLTVGGLRSATLQAGGVATNVAGNHRAVGEVTVQGIKDALLASVVNSNIAVWSLGKITLTGVNTPNGGTAFGLGGHTLANYTRGTVHCVNQVGALTLDNVEDYAVRLVYWADGV